MQLGVHSEAGPHLPATWLGALLASRGLLAGCSAEGTAGSKLRAGRTRTVLSLPRSEQGQAAGRGRRWPTRKWLTFAARAGNGQTVKEEVECGPSVPPPCPLGTGAQSRKCPAGRAFGCCRVGASRCHLRVPAGGFLGGLSGQGRNLEPWGPASASTHMSLPLSVPAWCTGPWECTPGLSGPRCPWHPHISQVLVLHTLTSHLECFSQWETSIQPSEPSLAAAPGSSCS